MPTDDMQKFRALSRAVAAEYGLDGDPVQWIHDSLVKQFAEAVEDRDLTWEIFCEGLPRFMDGAFVGSDKDLVNIPVTGVTDIFTAYYTRLWGKAGFRSSVVPHAQAAGWWLRNLPADGVRYEQMAELVHCVDNGLPTSWIPAFDGRELAFGEMSDLWDARVPAEFAVQALSFVDVPAVVEAWRAGVPLEYVSHLAEVA